MVEFIAQGLGDDGADEEEGGGHGVPSSPFFLSGFTPESPL